MVFSIKPLACLQAGHSVLTLLQYRNKCDTWPGGA